MLPDYLVELPLQDSKHYHSKSTTALLHYKYVFTNKLKPKYQNILLPPYFVAGRNYMSETIKVIEGSS